MNKANKVKNGLNRDACPRPMRVRTGEAGFPGSAVGSIIERHFCEALEANSIGFWTELAAGASTKPRAWRTKRK